MAHAFLITGGTEKTRAKKTNNLVKEYRIAHDGIIEVTPETENGAIGIDQIRNIKTRLALKTTKDTYKLCWIRGAHLMTIEAQNAILKTLEEPPGRAIIVLTTANPAQLLPTIRSRCQKIKLKSAIDIDLGNKEHKEAINNLVTLLKSSNGQRLVWSYNERGTERNSINKMLTYWLTAARDGLVNKYIPEAVINKDLTRNKNNPINRLGEKDLLRMIDNIKQAQINLSETNVNQQLSLDNLVLSFP
jgi:DNA polymerase III delta prime subunit